MFESVKSTLTRATASVKTFLFAGRSSEQTQSAHAVDTNAIAAAESTSTAQRALERVLLDTFEVSTDVLLAGSARA